MNRSEKDRRVSKWQNDVATLLLVDPVYNSRREAILEEKEKSP